MIMSVLAIGSVRTYHNTANDNAVNYYIDNSNYIKEISSPNSGINDYILIKKDKQPIISEVISKLNRTKVSYDSITLKVDKDIKQVPFLLYKGIHYEVKLNGKNVKIDVGGILNIKAKRGDTIQISSKATWWNYITFGVSILMLLLIIFWIIAIELKPKKEI